MTPFEPNIVGVLRGSAQFQWSVNRSYTNFGLFGLDLYKETRYNSVLMFSFSENQLYRTLNTTDRIHATVIGDVNTDIEVTYDLVLKNIQFEDENTSFLLRAIFLSPLVISDATAQLATVKGMHFSISLCVCVCVKVIF